MRLIDADSLWERACELEEQARLRLNTIEYNGGLFNTEWKIWSAILKERTAFKRILDNLSTVNEWIPCSERLPEEMERVLVYIDRPTNQICVSQRTDVAYWIGLGRVNVVAWQPLPKPYEGKENEGKEI